MKDTIKSICIFILTVAVMIGSFIGLNIKVSVSDSGVKAEETTEAKVENPTVKESNTDATKEAEKEPAPQETTAEEVPAETEEPAPVTEEIVTTVEHEEDATDPVEQETN